MKVCIDENYVPLRCHKQKQNERFIYSTRKEKGNEPIVLICVKPNERIRQKIKEGKKLILFSFNLAKTGSRCFGFGKFEARKR